MSPYTPPINDMLFVLKDLHGFQHEELDTETVEAVLEEAGKLASDVLAPLNATGDHQGAVLEDGEVTTAPGFKSAYQAYKDGGWNAVPFPEEFEGQGLPWSLAFPVQEMWQSANMSFGLCPLLNQGAIEAILSHGSEEQKQTYLPKLISGEWTGTMNLTEPQAGSDLGLLRTKAEKQGDGTYKITGQKIFITYGEHDLTDNIIHLVLARTTDAPEDVKGISLFLVPKILEDGQGGMKRNDVVCSGLEHKLGIHASPTCTMQFGDNGGATGYLIGEENQGLKYMFTMMNNARLSVGLQGVSVAERAYQHAKNYAEERVQGKCFQTGSRVTIDHHGDVKRMLLSMRAQIEAGRALTYEAAIALDQAAAGDLEAQVKVDILTPIVKAWCTDMACSVTSTGVQIHGGMGFVEETGAAQYYRDARILPIYEGTNGIQAADLVFRKVIRDEGVAVGGFIKLLEQDCPNNEKLMELLQSLKQKTGYLVDQWAEKKPDVLAALSHAYLQAFGIILGGVTMTKSLKAASNIESDAFKSQKIQSCKFFLYHILPFAAANLDTINDQAASSVLEEI